MTIDDIIYFAGIVGIVCKAIKELKSKHLNELKTSLTKHESEMTNMAGTINNIAKITTKENIIGFAQATKKYAKKGIAVLNAVVAIAGTLEIATNKLSA